MSRCTIRSTPAMRHLLANACLALLLLVNVVRNLLKSLPLYEQYPAKYPTVNADIHWTHLVTERHQELVFQSVILWNTLAFVLFSMLGYRNYRKAVHRKLYAVTATAASFSSSSVHSANTSIREAKRNLFASIGLSWFLAYLLAYWICSRAIITRAGTVYIQYDGWDRLLLALICLQFGICSALAADHHRNINRRFPHVARIYLFAPPTSTISKTTRLLDLLFTASTLLFVTGISAPFFYPIAQSLSGMFWIMDCIAWSLFMAVLLYHACMAMFRQYHQHSQRHRRRQTWQPTHRYLRKAWNLFCAAFHTLVPHLHALAMPPYMIVKLYYFFRWSPGFFLGALQGYERSLYACICIGVVSIPFMFVPVLPTLYRWTRAAMLKCFSL